MENDAIIGNVVAKGGGRFEWIIPFFRTLPRKKDAYFDGPDFDADGEKWFLRIFPNGTSGDAWIHVTLFRRCSGNETISCSVGLKRAGHSSQETIGRKTWGSLLSTSYVFDKTRRELQNGGWFTADGQLIVTCLFSGGTHLSQAAMENEAIIGNVVAEGGGIRFEWIIPDFRTLPQRKDAYFHSPDFNADGERCFLQILPNGTSSDTRIHVTLLRRSSGNETISCTVGLKRAGHSSEETIGRIAWSSLLSTSYVFDRTRRELQQDGGWFTADGRLTVTCLFSGGTHVSQVAMENGAIIGNVVAEGGGRFEWIIPDFRTLPQRKNANFHSPDFDADGERWFLQILPNSSDTRIRVTLLRRNSGNETISCTVGLKRAGHSSEETIGRKTWGSLLYSSYVFDRTRKELQQDEGWLPGGQLTVTCLFSGGAHAPEGDDEDSRRDVSQYCESKGVTRLSDHMKGLFTERNEDYDVTIFVKGQEFRAHKCILKARSPVLDMILTHDSEEKNSGTIRIEDCDPDCFGEFLLFVYCGRAENLTTSRALELYYAADKYDFPDLKEVCVHFLEASLSAASVCETVLLAAMHDEKQLLRTATEYFAKNTKQILLTVEWQNFMAENPTVANELLLKAL